MDIINNSFYACYMLIGLFIITRIWVMLECVHKSNKMLAIIKKSATKGHWQDHKTALELLDIFDKETDRWILHVIFGVAILLVLICMQPACNQIYNECIEKMRQESFEAGRQSVLQETEQEHPSQSR